MKQKTLSPLRTSVAGWLCMLWCAGLMPAQAAPQINEYQLKSVFLVAYTQFISWPEDAFADTESPYKICVLGDDPFGDTLPQTIKDGNNERQQAVRLLQAAHIRSLEEAGTCQVLYISQSEKPYLKPTLAALRDLPILLVSDIEDFARTGGMIEFFIRYDSKLRFRVNPARIRASGLKPSANLLRVAEIVRDKE